MSETTNNQESSNAGKHILAGFSGKMTVVSETLRQYGGPAGKKVGAVFEVVNGVIVETIEYYNEPSASDMERLEKAAVSLLAGIAAGAIVTLFAKGAVAIVGAGIAAVAVEEASDVIYEGYTYWKEKAFWLLDKFQHGILEPTLDSSKKLFTTATKVGSPVILDLDGDGVETTSIADGGAYFDHDGNGFAEQTGWAGADDGLLVMDRDGNGTIDTGKELFGDNTLLANGTKATNGFQALKELDTNNDNKIDINDTAYAQLKIWQDADGDGYTSEGELKTLSELGIQSINTGYTNSTTVDSNGNAHKQVGTFTRADGTVASATDVWFKMDKAYTIANEWLDVPADIAALPDLQGYGNVYDLQQAMVRDERRAV